MSDDSFFREVSEELRQDRFKAIWTRFGTTFLAAVVLVIAVTAGFVGWERYTASRANASGDRYLAALKLSEDGKPDEAVSALQSLSTDGYGAYPDFARMSIGSVREQQGQAKEAVAAFDVVANDTGAPQAIRDMAAIRAGYVLVDSGTLSQVQDRVQRLSGDSEPMRFPAREMIGLAAWKAGDTKTAAKAFQQLADDGGTPQGIAGRAKLMLDLIKSADTATASSAPAEATVPAPTPTQGEGDTAAPSASGEVAAPSSPASTSAAEPQAETNLDATPPAADAGAAETPADAPQPGTVTSPTTDLGTSSAADPAAGMAPSVPAAAPAPEVPAASQPAEPAPGSAETGLPTQVAPAETAPAVPEPTDAAPTPAPENQDAPAAPAN